MLRSFEQLRDPADGSLLIAADEGHATIRASGRAYATSWHWHDCLSFILPSRGAIELRHENQRDGIWLSQDRIALVPPGWAHETRAGPSRHEHLAIYVTAEALERIDSDLGSLGAFRRRLRAATLVRRNPAVRMLQELSLGSDPAGFASGAIRRNLSSALLLQCISEAITGEALADGSHRGHGAALVEEMKAFLTRDLDTEVPLDALAARFGVSRRHATRLFRARTGLSVGDFRSRARLEQATGLLTGTDLPVGEIAYRVGFESGAALARAMRRETGRSPSQIRAATLARSDKP